MAVSGRVGLGKRVDADSRIIGETILFVMEHRLGLTKQQLPHIRDFPFVVAASGSLHCSGKQLWIVRAMHQIVQIIRDVAVPRSHLLLAAIVPVTRSLCFGPRVLLIRVICPPPDDLHGNDCHQNAENGEAAWARQLPWAKRLDVGQQSASCSAPKLGSSTSSPATCTALCSSGSTAGARCNAFSCLMSVTCGCYLISVQNRSRLVICHAVVY